MSDRLATVAQLLGMYEQLAQFGPPFSWVAGPVLKLLRWLNSRTHRQQLTEAQANAVALKQAIADEHTYE